VFVRPFHRRLSLLITNTRAPAGSSNPAEMVEFLTESADQVGGVLAVGGFDEVIMVMGIWLLLRVGGSHTGRNKFGLSEVGLASQL